nr:MAG TPA: hypothetical protein [Caudoviricetes sp.]
MSRACVVRGCWCIVSGLHCGTLWGIFRGFCALVYIFVWVHRFSGLWRHSMWCRGIPRGGLTRGKTEQGSTLNILKK